MSLPARSSRGDSRTLAVIPDWLLRRYRHTSAPLMVLGGTCQERVRIADTFHLQSPLRRGLLVVVDGAREEGALRGALADWLTGGLGEAVPLAWRAAERGTLFLDRIDVLSASVQRLLLAFVQQLPANAGTEAAEGWAGRLITGAPEGLLRAVDTGRFSAPLFDALDKLRVELASRRAEGAA